MAKVIVGMVMSLDGFVSDRDGNVGRLYENMESMLESEQLQDAIRNTGAVIMGRRSYDMGDGDFTGYEFQTPIFVLTHQPPEQPALGENEHLRFTFVTEGVECAVQLAKDAAGDKDVTVVGGADTIRQIVAAGLADEIQIDLRPFLLGGGLRLFERTDDPVIELELLAGSESPGVTHLRYCVRK